MLKSFKEQTPAKKLFILIFIGLYAFALMGKFSEAQGLNLFSDQSAQPTYNLEVTNVTSATPE